MHNNLKNVLSHPLLKNLLLAAILLFAAYLRLNDIRDYQVFLGDQGRDVLVVKRMLVDHKFTMLGPNASVGGFFLGPFYYYLMIIPLALSQLDPIGPAIMVALLSIATTYLCYWFGNRYFSYRTGIIAAAIYAVSRLVVEYARTSWNPNVLPFFGFVVICAMALLYENNFKYKKMAMFVTGSCLGIIIQLHYQAVGIHIFALCAYVLYISKQTEKGYSIWKQHAGEMLSALVGGLLFFCPFLIFEIRHGFQNFTNIFKFVFLNKGDGFSGGYTYEFLTRETIHRLFLRLVAGGNELISQTVILITFLGVLLLLYIAISRFYVYVKSKQSTNSFYEDISHYTHVLFSHRRGIGTTVLLVWFVSSVLYWGFYKKAVYDYYYSYMYVLPIMLFTVACDTLMRFNSRRLQNNKAMIPVKIIGSCALYLLIAIILIVNTKEVKNISKGMQVYRAEMVANAIIQHKAPGDYNFALITPGNSDHAYRYFLEIKNQRPLTLEEQVTTQLLVFCEELNCEPLGNSLWEVAGFGQASIVGEWPAIGLQLFRLEHLPETKYLEGKPVKKGY